MKTRIVKQIKVFDIKASGQYLGGHGFNVDVPAIIYCENQIWESDEQCSRLLQESIKNWEERKERDCWGTTSHKPSLDIYWKTISVKEE